MTSIAADRHAEIMEAALELLCVPNDAQEEAHRWIQGVAMTYCVNDKKARDPHRIAHLSSTLTQISEHARELAKLLEDIEMFLAPAAAAFLSADDLANDEGRGHFSYKEAVIEGPSQLIHLLPQAAEFAERLSRRLPEDTGGESTLTNLLHGAPKQVLAIECWELFQYFCPGKATGTQHGDYDSFTGLVYELATGQEATEDGVGLHRYTKRAARLLRDLFAARPGLDRLYRALAPGQSPVGPISNMAVRMFGAPSRLLDELHQERTPD